MHSLNTNPTTTTTNRGSSSSVCSIKPGDENINPIRRKPSLLELTAKASAPTTTPPGAVNRLKNKNTHSSATTITTTTASNTRPRPTAAHARTTASTLKPSYTTTAALLHAQPSRTPLRQRDRNVAPSPVAAASRTPALAAAAKSSPQQKFSYSSSSSSSTAAAATSSSTRLTKSSPRMPPTNNSRQPQMPTLAKPAPRVAAAPLTPKIAAGPQRPLASQTQRPSSVYSTPLPRRNLAGRPESSLSLAEGLRDEGSSPVLLGYTTAAPTATVTAAANNNNNNNNNITPRSGTRQIRVDSASSTPTGTPQPDQHDLAWDARPNLGAPIDGPPRKPGVSFVPAPRPAAAESKFFYASSAKSAIGTQPIQQTQQQHQHQQQQQQQQAAPLLVKPLQKSSTFCYANGDSLPTKPGFAQASPALSGSFSPALGGHPSDAAFSGKFMYANGAPDVAPSLPKPGFASASRPGSSLSTSSRTPLGRPASAAAAPPPMGYGASRPVSPLKQPFYPAPKVSSALPSPMGRPASTLANYNVAPSMMRRTSNESSPIIPTTGGFVVAGHSRKESMVSITSDVLPLAAVTAATAATSRALHPRSPSETSSGSLTAFGVGGPAMGFASLLQAADDFAEETEPEDDYDDPDDDSVDSPQSSKEKDIVDELVSNARRERKVQDLEITNASLEAINRTLERQLRKQTAEIRRYRRLSRSGRLSLASMGSRVASDSTVEGPLRDPARLGLEDLSEEDGEEDEEEEEEGEDGQDHYESPDDLSDSEYGSGTGSSQLSPRTMEMRDARHRKRDERRLELDLSKHQQLLVDSQKINQSLKRCLGWTEELIKEGRRALQYQVRVSEVEIGGRVLVRNEDEDEDEMPSAVVVDFGHEDDNMTNMAFGGKGSQDRDSGIDLPPDGG